MLGIVMIATAVLVIFFFWRQQAQAEYGPAVALCPGPDQYGYTCEEGGGFSYIDATENTFLYDDDGVMPIPLPFPFTFYGTTYTDIYVGSNGTLQFGSGTVAFPERCLADGPNPGVGDLIAPYWDDLDLSFYGLHETATIGEAPNRIFVIEWDDVPRYGGNPDDTVTFEVQLFEGSDDILFLYQDVTTFDGNHGSWAIIGLQSEAQGLALQYSCGQPAVADANAIHFPHPKRGNPDVGQEMNTAVPSSTTSPISKGPAAEVIDKLSIDDPVGLRQLRTYWLSQTPPRTVDSHWLDLTGNGREELLLLWNGPAQSPELTQIAVLSMTETNQANLLLDQRLSRRDDPISQITLIETVDLTSDGRTDALLLDDVSGQLYMLSGDEGEVQLTAVPERCQGNITVMAGDEDGRLLIVRDGCSDPGRFTQFWDDQTFTSQEP